MIPSRLRGLSASWRRPLLVARDTALWFRHGRPRPLPGFRPVAELRRSIRVVSASWPGPGLEALRDRCRWENTTVQGALGAACLIALRAEFPGRRGVTLGLRTPVDLRPGMDRPVGPGDLGNFISVLLTLHRVKAGTEFWDLARQVRRRLHRRIRRGDGFVVWKSLPPGFLLPPTPSGARRAQGLFGLNPPAVMISNLGALPPLPEGNGIRVTDQSFVVPPMPRDPLSLCISSFQGQLTAHLAHSPASLDADMADRIKARFRDPLSAVMRDRDP